MPGLREIQEAFATAVLDDPNTAFSTLLSDGHYPGARLLQVYRNNVCSSLTNALRAVYPVVTQLVGVAFFAYAADSYLRRYPSRSGNLHDFGAEFAEFLGAFPAAMGLAYLPQVAHLEWAWHCAFHGAAHAPLAPATLSTVPAELHGAIVFLLHPTARLVKSDYPVLRLWQIHQSENIGELQAQPPDKSMDGRDRALSGAEMAKALAPGPLRQTQEQFSVNLAAGGDRLLVVRPRETVQIVPLGRGEYALLQSLAKGATLAEACDAALCEEAEFDLAGILQKHVQHATLVAFQVTGIDHPVAAPTSLKTPACQ